MIYATDDFIKDGLTNIDLKKYYKAVHIVTDWIYFHKEHATNGGIVDPEKSTLYNDLDNLLRALRHEIDTRNLKAPDLIRWR